MQQVLLRIPLKAAWLPAWLPALGRPPGPLSAGGRLPLLGRRPARTALEPRPQNRPGRGRLGRRRRLHRRGAGLLLRRRRTAHLRLRHDALPGVRGLQLDRRPPRRERRRPQGSRPGPGHLADRRRPDRRPPDLGPHLRKTRNPPQTVTGVRSIGSSVSGTAASSSTAPSSAASSATSSPTSWSFASRRPSTLKLADIIAPTLAVGLCLGRIGCFLNGCCYGQVACTDCAVAGVPFPLVGAAALRTGQGRLPDGGRFHPRPPPGPRGRRPGGPRRAGLRRRGRGLQPGDVIVKADDKPVVRRRKTWTSTWPTSAPGRAARTTCTLEVRTGDGPTRTLTIVPWTLRLHPTQLYETVSMILLVPFAVRLTTHFAAMTGRSWP